MKLRTHRRAIQAKVSGTAETEPEPERAGNEASEPQSFAASRLCAELTQKFEYMLNSIKS